MGDGFFGLGVFGFQVLHMGGNGIKVKEKKF